MYRGRSGCARGKFIRSTLFVIPSGVEEFLTVQQIAIRDVSTSLGMTKRQARGMRYLNLRSKISPANCGLAFPLESFITCPLRKLSDAALPALKSAAGFGLAKIT